MCKTPVQQEVLSEIKINGPDPTLVLYRGRAFSHRSDLEQYLSTESAISVHRAPLHDMIGVWCAVSATMIIEPFFFSLF